MTVLGRMFFGFGIICFIIAGLLWDSLYGVIAWRVGVALMLTAIGVAVLWPEGFKQVGIAFFFGLIQLVTVIFALSIYLMQEQMGMAAVLLLTVVAPVLIVLLIAYQVIKKREDVPLTDQLLPLAAFLLFLLPFLLQSGNLIERIPLQLLKWISYGGFGVLGVVIYRLYRQLKQ
jgi:hypothetical protein